MKNMWWNLDGAKLRKGNILIDSLLVIYIVSITIMIMMNYYLVKVNYYNVENEWMVWLYDNDYERLMDMP